MRLLDSRKGAGLVDVLVTLFLLTAIGLIFSVTFPAGFRCTGQAKGYKVAAAIAQRKMEQLRATTYESLTQPLLLSAGLIDAEPTSPPYSFTSVDNLAAQLPNSTGTLDVQDLGADTKRITVTIDWEGASADAPRRVRLVSIFADRRTRALP